MIPRVATIESYTRSFQYLIINNALFLNKRLYRAGLVESAACTFCEQHEESPIHFFCECHTTKQLWKNLQRFLRPSLSLPELNLKNALLGYVSSVNIPERRQTVTLINHIILIFKRSLYEMRSSRPCPSVFYVINRIKQIKEIEYKIAQVNDKLGFHLEKWEPLSNLLQ